MANTSGSALGLGNLTLSGGTLASGAVGSLSGSILPGTGSYSIAPGGVAGLGTLTIGGNMGLNSGSTLDFNLNNTTSDLLAVNGALGFSGTGTAMIDFASIGGLLTSSTATYTLATVSNSAGLTANEFTLTGSTLAGYGLQVSGGSLLYETLGPPGLLTATSGTASWNATGSWANKSVPASGTVTFSSTSSDPITVTLDANQSAEALVFNVTGTSGYTLAQGTGGTLTLGTSAAGASISLLGGTHAISAPLTLAGSGDVVAAPGTQLTISGNIGQSGTQSLTFSGGGTLILSGSNSYTGGTDVDAGTLYVTDTAAIADGTSLAVGSGGIFIFDPTVAAAPGESASGVATADRVAAVPEPSTIVLLLAALWSAAWVTCTHGHRRFSKRQGRTEEYVSDLGGMPSLGRHKVATKGRSQSVADHKYMLPGHVGPIA